MNYSQLINELVNKVIKNNLIHKNTVIIGENSTGKTTLLKSILNKTNDCIYIEDLYKQKENAFNKSDINTVLIDNIEIGLDYREIMNINNYLISKFGERKLVIVTHNLDIVAQLEHFNIIYLYKDCYCIYDGDDFNNINDVMNIFKTENTTTDIILLTLLNLVYNWTSVEEEKLKEIEKMNLSMTQKIILNEIKGCLVKYNKN